MKNEKVYFGLEVVALAAVAIWIGIQGFHLASCLALALVVLAMFFTFLPLYKQMNQKRRP